MATPVSAYLRNYPQGFKRKRDSVQREKQRVAQRRYERERRAGPMRRSMHALRNFARGVKCGDTSCEELTGLSLPAFYQHIRSTLAVPDMPFTLRFYKPLKRFNLNDLEQVKKAMHYKNVYATARGSGSINRALSALV